MSDFNLRDCLLHFSPLWRERQKTTKRKLNNVMFLKRISWISFRPRLSRYFCVCLSTESDYNFPYHQDLCYPKKENKSREIRLFLGCWAKDVCFATFSSLPESSGNFSEFSLLPFISTFSAFQWKVIFMLTQKHSQKLRDVLITVLLCKRKGKFQKLSSLLLATTEQTWHSLSSRHPLNTRSSYRQRSWRL